MKRALHLVVKGAIAAAFIVCVELLLWRRRCRYPIANLPVPAPPPPGRLRVRRGSDRSLVTFAIEGTIDEFAARMLACSVAQLPSSTTTILDLSGAGPIRDGALLLFGRVFTVGRRIRLRGLREHHVGLLALG